MNELLAPAQLPTVFINLAQSSEGCDVSWMVTDRGGAIPEGINGLGGTKVQPDGGPALEI